MSCLSDSAPLIAGAALSSLYDGHGVLGRNVPTVGQHGPALLYPGLNLPVENDDEFRALILTQPAGLTSLHVYEDSSLDADGPAGIYVGSWRGYKNGVAYAPDPSTYTIIIGGGVLAGDAPLDDAGAAGAVSAEQASAVGGGDTHDGATAKRLRKRQQEQAKEIEAQRAEKAQQARELREQIASAARPAKPAKPAVKPVARTVEELISSSALAAALAPTAPAAPDDWDEEDDEETILAMLL